eukprot:gene20512-27302_t
MGCAQSSEVATFESGTPPRLSFEGGVKKDGYGKKTSFGGATSGALQGIGYAPSMVLGGHRTDGPYTGEGAVGPIIEQQNSRVWDRESLKITMSGNSNRGSQENIARTLSNLLDGQGTLKSSASASLRRFSNCALQTSGTDGAVVLQDTNFGGQIKLLKQIGSYGKVFLGDYMGERVAIKAVFGQGMVPQEYDDDDDKPGVSERDAAMADEKAKEERMVQLEALLMSLVENEHIVRTLKCLSTFRLKNEDGQMATKLEEQTAKLSQGHAKQTVSYKWFIIMEYCSRGCLWKALHRGEFHVEPELGPFEPTKRGISPPNLFRTAQKIEAKSSVPNEREREMVGFDIWAAIETLKEVVKATQYLHRNGVVHGDIKAANILLSSDTRDRRGFVGKLTDFGFARILQDGSDHVNTKSFGTVTHMPPELLEHGTMSPPTDVFSMAMVMWEMFASKGVHQELSDADVVLQVVNHNLRPTWPPNVPMRFKKLAEAMWDADMKLRPSLENVLEEFTGMQAEYAPQIHGSQN